MGKHRSWDKSHLQLGRAAHRNVPRYVAERRRHSGPQPRGGDENSVPADLQAGRHDVLRLKEIQEARLVREDVVEEGPLRYRLEHVGPRPADNTNQPEQQARQESPEMERHMVRRLANGRSTFLFVRANELSGLGMFYM